MTKKATKNTQEQASPPPVPRGGFSTRWQPGMSGNPSGRPKGFEDTRTRVARDLLAENVREAVAVIVSMMRNAKYAGVRLKAAESVCDRVGLPRATRTEAATLDPDVEDERDLLRNAWNGELDRLEALTDAIEEIYAACRQRRDTGAQAV